MIQVKNIISQETYLSIRYVASYESILNCKYDKEYIYHTKRNLTQQLANSFIERNFVKISEIDTPEGRAYQASIYIYTYPQLVELLTKAYYQGQLDRLAAQPLHMSNFNDPSK